MKAKLCTDIANIISDYRKDEINMPTAEHVMTWVKQFPDVNQDLILQEMLHVLTNSYFNHDSVIEFISGLIYNDKLVEGQPDEFWRRMNFLNIQQGGSSQREMLQHFDLILQKKVGLNINNCGSPTGPFLYLDDAIFSGNRVLRDLSLWLQSTAPVSCVLHIVVIAFHRGGQWYASQKLKQAALKAGKNITIHWWRCVEIEDRKYYLSNSDVLRPTVFPDDIGVQQYVNHLSGQGYPPEVRRESNPPYQSKFFKTEHGRQVLEQTYLTTGVQIKQMCPFMPEAIRPLGYSILKTLGFGSVIVTFRNCPNTCPPALWAGDPWYPLFPRKTN